jgi:serralysin
LNNSPPGPALRDTITDFFKGQDIIDLSALDANQNIPGNQAFTFLGETRIFTAAGQVIFNFNEENQTTVLNVELNGDGIADFQIGLLGIIPFTAADLIL